MKKMTEKRSLLARLRDDRRGNFAMMTAFALPVILGAGGFAMDISNMVLKKAELQDALDSAALAAASALTNDKKSITEAKAIALTFFKTQMINKNGDAGAASAFKIDVEEKALAGSAKSFKVSTSSGLTVEFNPLSRLLGQKSTTVSANGTAEGATGSKNALSMFLVLDRSGSMSFQTNEIASKTVACQNWTSSNWGGNPKATTPCYIRKIGALKTAVASLFGVLNKIDPNNEYVRAGAVSYNDVMQPETQLTWGTSGAMSYVNALPEKPEGGTDSHSAFAKAFEKLAPSDSSKETEIGAHKQKSGLEPVKFIVFMTDGENTHYNGKDGTANAKKSDDETLNSCTAAKAAGVTVYTVAFMAPTRGQTLLKACASSAANYYAAEDMSGLISAFEEIGKSAAAIASRLTQ
ncbi:TadE/TadG family type IV pilus assembly protein [Shinella zoogloeoides]|uniref:vWA domain-containing protein n=1 Tax=Shinella zoogloeoides TaxID=352475 RepID=UPI0028AF0414|nr:TadE/TadG family type IV pilus assembly protein [Shinella zoogloeoides]